LQKSSRCTMQWGVISYNSILEQGDVTPCGIMQSEIKSYRYKM
jgi:hypothetical protein